MIIILPNPNRGEAQLMVTSLKSAEMKVEIMNSTGQYIRQFNMAVNSGNNSLTLDLQNEVPGLYLIRVSQEGSRTIGKKMILQR